MKGSIEMPLISIDLTEGNLNVTKKEQLIAALTDAGVQVLGEDARKSLIVTIRKTPRGNRRIAGKV
jgi:phenylpyruvate tautomerase PptA (4-oxalocrotonate tautomerase family)